MSLIDSMKDAGTKAAKDAVAEVGGDALVVVESALGDIGVPASIPMEQQTDEQLKKAVKLGSSKAAAILAKRYPTDVGVFVLDGSRIQNMRSSSLRKLIGGLLSEVAAAAGNGQPIVAADILGRRTQYSAALGRQLVGVYWYLNWASHQGTIRVGPAGERVDTGIPTFEPATIAALYAQADTATKVVMLAGQPVNTWGHAVPGVAGGASSTGGSLVFPNPGEDTSKRVEDAPPAAPKSAAISPVLIGVGLLAVVFLLKR